MTIYILMMTWCFIRTIKVSNRIKGYGVVSWVFSYIISI